MLDRLLSDVRPAYRAAHRSCPGRDRPDSRPSGPPRRVGSPRPAAEPRRRQAAAHRRRRCRNNTAPHAAPGAATSAAAVGNGQQNLAHEALFCSRSPDPKRLEARGRSGNRRAVIRIAALLSHSCRACCRSSVHQRVEPASQAGLLRDTADREQRAGHVRRGPSFRHRDGSRGARSRRRTPPRPPARRTACARACTRTPPFGLADRRAARRADAAERLDRLRGRGAAHRGERLGELAHRSRTACRACRRARNR